MRCGYSLLLAFLAFAAASSTVLVFVSDGAPKAKTPVASPHIDANIDSSDCLLVVRLSKTAYERGERILAEIEYRNRTDHDLTIWSCGFCPNHQVVVKDEAGESPPLTARGIQCRDAFAPGGDRDKNYPIVIGPGKTHLATEKVDVASLYQLESGKRYALEVVYDDPLPPTPLKMTSKAVKFEVIEADDAKADADPKEAECLLIVSLPKTAYKRSEKIIPEIVYKNQGGRDLTIWNSGFWPNHKIVIKDEAGDSPPLTAEGARCRDAFAPDGGRDKNVPIVIEPGKSRQWSSIDVAGLYQLESGKRYALEVVYDDRQEPTPLKMTSRPVEFEVIGSDDANAGADAEPKEAECLLVVGLPKTTYKRGVKIIPDIEYINRSSRDLMIWDSRFCLNHQVLVKDEAGGSPPLTARGIQCRDAFAPAGGRDGGRTTVVKPGMNHFAAVRLDVASLYELEPGKEYTLQVVYEDPPLKIASEAIEFRVR